MLAVFKVAVGVVSVGAVSFGLIAAGAISVGLAGGITFRLASDESEEEDYFF